VENISAEASHFKSFFAAPAPYHSPSPTPPSPPAAEVMEEDFAEPELVFTGYLFDALSTDSDSASLEGEADDKADAAPPAKHVRHTFEVPARLA
jgi:hypothetical protein